MQTASKKKKTESKKVVSYRSFATNIRVKDWAVVLCETKYAEPNIDPEVLAQIIGDALEYYGANYKKITEEKENAKKELQTDK